MVVEPSTSLEGSNTKIPIMQRWTKNLHVLPSFNQELSIKHLGTENSGRAHKHKKVRLSDVEG